VNKSLRVFLILSFDIFLILLASNIAYFIRLEKLDANNLILKYLFIYSVIYLFIFFIFKLKDLSHRYFSLSHTKQLLFPFICLFVIWSAYPIFFQIIGYPRSLGVLTFLIFLICYTSSRVLISKLLNYKNNKKNIIFIGFNENIYDLISAYTKRFNVSAIFVNKNIKFNYKNILGVKIRDLDGLLNFLEKKKIDQVIIDNKYFKKPIIKKLLLNLNQFQAKILSVNSENQLSVEDVQQVELNDIIYRGITDLKFSGDFEINDKVLITGGAGSIGSAIIKQIANKFNNISIVCLDSSENNIYNIQEDINNNNIEFVVGDINDRDFVKHIINKYSINIIFHTAAYKHVPIMEYNIYQSFKNNCLGTLCLSEEAVKSKIKKFIFVSSDKAVRPTNVMGLSKRLSESIIDYYQQQFNQKKIDTKFSIVRFGNVLESSGSLIPLLRKQILSGGPITITHKDVTRYFMTLSEAAHLVIESSFLTNGFEIFLFDMGEPIKILDLAKRMVNLYGRQIKTETNIDGIEIKYVGLRPGEKLYEELLVDNKAFKTINSNIYISQEKRVSSIYYEKYFNFLKSDLTNIDYSNLIEIFNDDYIKYDKR